MADIESRIYSNFRGADFRGEEINIIRSPDCLNVWKDYKNTESIRTRPGLELFKAFPAPIYGIYFHKNAAIVHSGKKLYRVDKDGTIDEIFPSMREAPSQGFIYGEMLYIKDGANYLQYNGGAVASDVIGYVPTTSIARKPEGGGKTLEDVNLLSDRRKNSFLGDGTSRTYYLDTQNISDSFYPIVTVDGVTLDKKDYDVLFAEGKVTFRDPPPSPLTEGQDNVVVEFEKFTQGYRDAILKCTMLQVFDNRVFFSGNEDNPNMIRHCSLDNPTYCSDTDYYNDGLDRAKVRGMVAGNNALWVFREPSNANTTVFYHTPTLDDEYGKVYPSTHSSITTGCVGKAINFNDDIVFFSDRGMEGISGDVTTEQVLSHRSSLVDRKLTAEAGYTDMILAEWEGYLLVFIDERVYLADSRGVFTNLGHFEYEWFYWDIGKKVTCTCVEDGVLYLGTDDGVYTLTDNEVAVESYWITPKDKFEHPHKLKTSNKRGCVVEGTGDISIYAKTESTDFELIGRYKDVSDYCVSRIKRKKFKDIQLKFYTDTRFSLETATLECFIGGYIKR